MAAHNLTDIAYQQLLLFIIATKLRPMVLWYTLSLRDHIRFAADDTPSLLAMNLEEVQSLFSARLDVFDTILGKLTDTELKLLYKDLTTILLHLLYNVEKVIHNLMGIIMDEDDYKVCYCAKFPTTTKPDVYDEDIPNNATNGIWAKAEDIHTAKIVY